MSNLLSSYTKTEPVDIIDVVIKEEPEVDDSLSHEEDLCLPNEREAQERNISSDYEINQEVNDEVLSRSADLFHPTNINIIQNNIDTCASKTDYIIKNEPEVFLIHDDGSFHSSNEQNTKVDGVTITNSNADEHDNCEDPLKNINATDQINLSNNEETLKMKRLFVITQDTSRKSKSSIDTLPHSSVNPLSSGQCEKCLPPCTCTHSAEKTFTCAQCGKTFTKQRGLYRHKLTHSEAKPFSCVECGKSFKQKNNLNAHMLNHSGEKPFSCPQCGKGFTQKSNLNNHILTHSVLKPFSCTECGKCFTQKSGLTVHMLIHFDEKQFSCTVCGKCFTQHSGLSTHMLTHSKVKPFSCEQCGKCFAQNGYLSRHMLTHSGLKPFKCSQCGKCFTLKNSLLQHKLIHSGIKPFSCDQCGHCYTQKSNLTRHILTHSR